MGLATVASADLFGGQGFELVEPSGGRRLDAGEDIRQHKSVELSSVGGLAHLLHRWAARAHDIAADENRIREHVPDASLAGRA